MRELRALTVVAIAALATAGDCAQGPETVEGIGGLDGVLAFAAPADQFFSTGIVIGSVFEIVARPGLQTDKDVLDGIVDVGSTNPEVLAVEPVGVERGAFTFRVTVTGRGRARLAVTADGKVLDRVNLSGVPAATTSLVDAMLLGFPGLDIGLPARFALIESREVNLAVAAVDKCGNGLIDAGASVLRIQPRDPGSTADDVAVVERDGITGYSVSALADNADFAIVLETPGLAPLSYRVDAVDASNVDDVKINVASADGDSGAALAWGRAFADDIEVIGLSYAWSADRRVSLGAFDSPAVNVSVAPLETDEFGNTIDAPAELYADVLGESASIDLIALTSASLNASRGPGPVRAGETKPDTNVDAGGCGGGESTVCDPLAALLPALGLRRLRRRRRGR